jgi:hypothetical protein
MRSFGDRSVTHGKTDCGLLPFAPTLTPETPVPISEQAIFFCLDLDDGRPVFGGAATHCMYLHLTRV